MEYAEQERFLILRHHLTNFKTQKQYQNEPKFKDVYSRNNLSNLQFTVKVGTYVVNLYEY